VRRRATGEKKKPRAARWRTRIPSARPKIVVVGFGRLGGALAMRLKAADWPVAVLPRSSEAVRRATRLGMKLAGRDDLQAAVLCLLAVPDAAVGSVASTVEGDLGPKSALIHCAGALDLNAFGSSPSTLKRLRGSFHPLVAVSDPRDALADHSVALAASDRALMPVLWRMALVLRMRPLEVPEARRAAYHAGAVMSAGLIVSLIDAACTALQEAGIDRDAALNALLPLASSALQGVEKRGLRKGLTGPIPRGDLAVVRAHLEALPPPLSELYRLLSARALSLVGDTLPAETRLALQRLLS
jgi:predicted short-subunit dehydrogenase-like oxidoreductase (DUF2520 family)